MRAWVSRRVIERLLSAARFPPLPAIETVPGLASRAQGIRSNGSRGVNVFAYFRGQFGLGESARLYVQALMGAGYPVALNDIELVDVPHGFDDHGLVGEICNEAPFDLNLIFVNPDFFQKATDKIGHERLAGRYTIACWFWELESIPEEWQSALDRVDEVLVASEFVENAVRRVTKKPVLRVPLPLAAQPDSGLQRTDFGLDADTFIFLSSFDFNSSVYRKNPLGAIAAFQMAFPDPAENVRLVIKSSNGHRYPTEFFGLMDAAAADPRILIREGIIERAHMHALQRCADAYVSLHRAEGFGLGLAECMALGKPVIGTGWSGNLEFMHQSNSCLVDYQLVPVSPGQYLHAEDCARWAEPSISHAAALMRKVKGDTSFARSLGQRAASDMAKALAPERAAAMIAQRLDEISSARHGSPQQIPVRH